MSGLHAILMFCNGFKQRTRCMQYISAISAALLGACASTYATWPSPSLPKLTSAESPIGVTLNAEETSWLLSMTSLGMIISSCIKFAYAEKFGRKTWMQLCGVLLAVPWIIIYFSKFLTLLYIARFIGGLGLGIVFTTVPVYIAEIVEKDIRGKLMLTIGILMQSGNLFVYAVGPFLSYFDFALCCGALPMLNLVLIYFIPESPYYLLIVGQKNAAYNVLKALLSQGTDSAFVGERLTEMENTVTNNMKNKSRIWELLSKTQYRRSMLMVLAAKTIYQLCGLTAIEAYAQTIVIRANSSISPEISSILFGLIQLPAVILASLLVDKVGRKPLGVISAAGCFTTLFVLGLYFYLDKVDSFTWLPTACIMLFLIMCNIGVIILPLVLLGEIFSTNVRSVAASLAMVYASLLHFTVLRSFVAVLVNFGMHVAFWIFAGVCLLGVCLFAFVIPETKGKTLEDIQKMLNGRRRISKAAEENIV